MQEQENRHPIEKGHRKETDFEKDQAEAGDPGKGKYPEGSIIASYKEETADPTPQGHSERHQTAPNEAKTANTTAR